MTTTIAPELHSRAAAAYDDLADAYDVLTDGYCHETWLGAIEHRAKQHGLRGHRLLDLACGTGKSFLPLMARGYDVVACDISSEMVRIAREKAPAAQLTVRDMRALPKLGEFDLVTCLDDAVNYLLTPSEVGDFMDGVARNLSSDGVAVFDVNSLELYRTDFGGDWLIDDPRAFVAWSASVLPDAEPGALSTATIHVFTPGRDGWRRSRSIHHQRHWPRRTLESAIDAAGLRVVAVYGQHRGARLDAEFDELRHVKALYMIAPGQGR